VHQRDTAVDQRLGIELASGESEASKGHGREREFDGVFEIPVLSLELVRSQVHPLEPHDSGKKSHAKIRLSRPGA
jgi:hypothetical protein